MNILYLTFDDLEQPFAWSVHSKGVIAGLQQLGHKVLLLNPKGSLKEYFFGSFSKILNVKRGNHFNLDLIYCRGIHLTPTPYLAAKKLGVPLVLEVNGLLQEELRNKIIRAIFLRVQRYYLQNASAIVTVSNRLKAGLVRYGIKSREMIRVIPNGTNADVFRPMDQAEARRQLFLEPDTKIAIYVGSFYPHHGLELLVEAVNLIIRQRRKKVHLFIIGDGVTRQAVETYVRQRDLCGYISFLGRRAHHEIPLWIGASDVCTYILKSPYSPYFGFSPIKVYEYMGSARPVAVISNLSEITNFVNENRIGIARQTQDPEELANIIETLFSDPALCIQLGRNGRRLVEEYYNWGRVAKDIQGVLFEVINGKGS
jgi:glycosyltransferase involved in cell wall biosynthesis